MVLKRSVVVEGKVNNLNIINRVRKMKEARALSEMQKRMNRRGFGVASENYADEAMGIDYGMLSENTGDLRKVVAKKMKLCRLYLSDIIYSTKDIKEDWTSFK